ncbi:MAG: tetratricopeptide repeat protein [Desulfatitalea sp.]
MDPSQLATQAQAHIDAGRLEEAAEIYRRILDQYPGDADTHHILGLVYAEQAQWGNARAAMEAAIRHNPRKAIFYRSLADTCRSAGDGAAALAAYKQALQFLPDDPDTLLNLGNLLHADGDPKKAMACYEKILATRPDHAPALNNIGKLHYDQCDIESAIKCYNESIQHDAGYAEAHFNRAVAFLLKGELAQGWLGYEWRFKRKNARRVYPHPLRGRRWDGSPFGGERLLVHCEQGLGDVLHFCRYLPMVKALGGTVILEAQQELLPLLQTMPAVDEIVAFDPGAPPATKYDRYIPLLSLPLLMKTTLDKVPAPIPYLQAETERTVLWRDRVATEGLRVGLVWSGSDTDPQRTCRLADWRPWWANRQIQFYSLQKGAAADQAGALGDAYPIVHLGESLADFSHTAAAIANLDLIIAVDTAAAHLAGAMGKPVWVLLPFVPDWRWLLQRSDSPWYPTARLFRQTRANDWSQVISDVDAALSALISQMGGNAVAPDPERSKTFPMAGPQARAHFEEGQSKADSGDLSGAVTSFQQALSAHPGWAEAHFELGRAYHSQGRFDQAIAAYRAASRLAPDMQPAYTNLGLAYYQSGDLEQSASAYKQVIGLHRNLALVFNNLGVVREDQRNIEEAVACYLCALRIDPTYADAHYNLGNIHLARHQLEQALACYTQALQSDPRHVKAHGNLGRAYHLMGLLDQAMDCYNRALSIDSDNPEAHLNRAVTLLLIGDWEAGWSDYEWRFQCHDWKRTYPHRLYGQRWQGEAFKGQTLLVHSEQGIGDAIQFARYLPMVKARGGRVIFEARRSLMRLFASLTGVDELIELSADKPPCAHYHVYVPLGSLPAIFKTTLNTVPNEEPYIKADPAKVAVWKRRLPAEGLNVGLVWGGNDTYKERSCTLADMAPLAFVKGIHWIGLQKGPAAAQARPELLPRNFKVDNWGEAFEDFSDTAAAVECLDLIISIDTAAAHLAGAMGKPVWVLLPAVPDWRWLLERSQSPWYPNAHLFRQSREGNWSRVIAHMSASLEQWRKTQLSQ